MATDSTGRFDEWRRPRQKNALTEAFGLDLGVKTQRLKVGKGRVAYLSTIEPAGAVRGNDAAASTGRSSHEDALPPRNWRQIEDALRWAAGGRFTFEARAPRGVAIEYRQGPEPCDRVVHVMNFNGRRSPAQAAIEMECAPGDNWQLEVLAPGKESARTTILHPKDGRVRWSTNVEGLYTACVLRPWRSGTRR